jgi:hypothetical protein
VPGLSFGLIHPRPPPFTGVRVFVFAQATTVVNAGERRAALLESVLGATPQEFESPILRASDLHRYRLRRPMFRWLMLSGLK